MKQLPHWESVDMKLGISVLTSADTVCALLVCIAGVHCWCALLVCIAGVHCDILLIWVVTISFSIVALLF